MINFEIDPLYLTDITIHKKWISEAYYELNDEEKVLALLKGKNYNCSSMSSDDHPEFKKLREQLGQEKFIKIQRRWWNGDVVLKPFTLNGAKFKKGEQFSSGAAIKYVIDSKQKKQGII